MDQIMGPTVSEAQPNEQTDNRNDGDTQLFFVGTYSGEGSYVPTAHGKGIISCILHTQTGTIEHLSVCDEIANASYLAKSGENNLLFAVDDRFDEFGSVKAFSYEQE